MIFSRRIAFLSALAILSSGLTPAVVEAQSRNGRKARVVVYAAATPAYEELKASLPEGYVLTYNIMPGTFHGGGLRDSSLEKFDFTSIAEDVAERLKEKNLFPSPDVQDADLLVRVSWGTADSPIDWAEEAGGADLDGGGDGEIPDLLDGNVDSGDSDEIDPQEFAAISSGAGSSELKEMARLVGFEKAMLQANRQSDFEDYRDLLSSDRYFVAVQVFDFKKLRDDKEVVVYWTTRYSMDTVGFSFDEAYLALSRAASGYFGENLDALAREKVNVGRGEGKVGELEVIGTEKE